MSRHLFLALIATSFSTSGLISSTALSQEKSTARVLPVLELWYVGERTPSHPEIVLLSDGRMQIMSPSGPERTQLDPVAFRELMDGLLKEDGLARVKPDEMQQEILAASMQTGLSAEFPGTNDTVIRIRVEGEYRELRCHALGVLANRFPEIDSVKSVAEAQRRLENVRAIATVGGQEEAKYIADLACEHVEDRHGVRLPISPDDLSMVRALPDGSRFSQFVVLSKSQGEDVIQMVSVTETPGDQPHVSVIGPSFQ